MQMLSFIVKILYAALHKPTKPLTCVPWLLMSTESLHSFACSSDDTTFKRMLGTNSLVLQSG